MEIGVDSFAASISDPVTGIKLHPVERMQHLLEQLLSMARSEAPAAREMAPVPLAFKSSAIL